jgi:chromatin structure-remodeling complex subunit RSC1/2
MKTGQYRDHPIDEVVDRCFVMFFTRYNKGRPRGFPKDKDVYVCECRYNEEKHKLNKIKTWASCLPDEVRDKDYEMDLFDQPKKLKKVLSPISYTLPKDAKETDELPKPKWGAPNAPPTIGAVHTRPRDPKVSSSFSKRVCIIINIFCLGFSTSRTNSNSSTSATSSTSAANVAPSKQRICL